MLVKLLIGLAMRLLEAVGSPIVGNIQKAIAKGKRHAEVDDMVKEVEAAAKEITDAKAQGVKASEDQRERLKRAHRRLAADRLRSLQ